MKTKTLIAAMTALAMINAPLARAGGLSEASTGMSNASMAISNASGVMVQGSVAVLAGVGQLVVAAVETAGESTVMVLRGIGSGVEISLKVASSVAAGASIAVGTVVVVTTEAVGYSLVAAGRLIAFIPNEAGRALLYQAKLD
jgi:hypothetical protein